MYMSLFAVWILCFCWKCFPFFPSRDFLLKHLRSIPSVTFFFLTICCVNLLFSSVLLAHGTFLNYDFCQFLLCCISVSCNNSEIFNNSNHDLSPLLLSVGVYFNKSAWVIQYAEEIFYYIYVYSVMVMYGSLHNDNFILIIHLLILLIIMIRPLYTKFKRQLLSTRTKFVTLSEERRD